MNYIELTIKSCFFLFCFTIGYCFVCYTNVWASSGCDPDSFRSKYDIIMNWVNFTIILIIIFRYGAKPFKKFIKNQKTDIIKQINTLETKRKIITLELEEASKNAEKNKNNLISIRKRIIIEGEKKCLEIIKSAENQSNLMIKNAQQKTLSQIASAKEKLKNELTDIVIQSAGEKIQTLIKKDYDKTIVEQYVKTI